MRRILCMQIQMNMTNEFFMQLTVITTGCDISKIYRKEELFLDFNLNYIKFSLVLKGRGDMLMSQEYLF